MTHRLSPAHLVLTLAVVTVWGFAFVPIRLALDEINHGFDLLHEGKAVRQVVVFQ